MNAAPRITRLGEDALLCFFTAPDDTAPPLPVQQALWQLCQRLEAERAALAARGFKCRFIVQIEVHAVENNKAKSPRREHALLQGK